MSINSYAEAREHVGHIIVVAEYGPSSLDPLNVAIQCEDCDVILMDWNNPEITIIV